MSPALPGGTLPIYSRSGTLFGYDPNFVTPYTQNFNLSVTSSVPRNITVDIRYIGTQSKKQESDINLNTNNIYFNGELIDALDAARRGEDPLLLTQMMAGLNLSGAPASEGYATRERSIAAASIRPGPLICVATQRTAQTCSTVTTWLLSTPY